MKLRPSRISLLSVIAALSSAACSAPEAAGAEDRGFERSSLGTLELSVLAGGVGQPGSADGVGSAARFGRLYGVATDTSGDAFVIEPLAVRRIDAAGVVSTFGALPTYGEDPPDLPDPRGIAGDGSGSVFVANNNLYTVDKLSAGGALTRVAGTLFDNSSAGSLDHPEGVAVDAAGNLYIADTWNHRIAKLAPGGVLTTLASGLSSPRGVAVDGAGRVLVADTGNAVVRRVDAAGVVTLVAGALAQTGSVDGPAHLARFSDPRALAAGRDGRIYVVDGTTIRQITTAGMVTTLVGVAGQSLLQLGPLPAGLHSPSGVAITSAGDLLITESLRNVVLRVEGAGPACTSGGCGTYLGRVRCSGTLQPVPLRTWRAPSPPPARSRAESSH